MAFGRTEDALLWLAGSVGVRATDPSRGPGGPDLGQAVHGKEARLRMRAAIVGALGELSVEEREALSALVVGVARASRELRRCPRTVKRKMNAALAKLDPALRARGVVA